jgi:hypothetical protein
MGPSIQPGGEKSEMAQSQSPGPGTGGGQFNQGYGMSQMLCNLVFDDINWVENIEGDTITQAQLHNRLDLLRQHMTNTVAPYIGETPNPNYNQGSFVGQQASQAVGQKALAGAGTSAGGSIARTGAASATRQTPVTRGPQKKTGV